MKLEGNQSVAPIFVLSFSYAL